MKAAVLLASLLGSLVVVDEEKMRPVSYFPWLGSAFLLEHSNSRFESIRFVMRIDSFSKKIGLSIH